MKANAMKNPERLVEPRFSASTAPKGPGSGLIFLVMGIVSTVLTVAWASYGLWGFMIDYGIDPNRAAIVLAILLSLSAVLCFRSFGRRVNRKVDAVNPAKIARRHAPELALLGLIAGAWAGTRARHSTSSRHSFEERSQ